MVIYPLLENLCPYSSNYMCSRYGQEIAQTDHEYSTLFLEVNNRNLACTKKIEENIIQPFYLVKTGLALFMAL